jgi:hypothetical protein
MRFERDTYEIFMATIIDIDSKSARESVRLVCTDEKEYHPIPEANSEEVRKLLDSPECSDGVFVEAHYDKGTEIVSSGVIADEKLLNHQELKYAFVPLGYIVSGDITVIKGGKGLKKLGKGDLLGLFETSDALLTGRRRQIGDWTLFASTDATVIYFSDLILRFRLLMQQGH